MMLYKIIIAPRARKQIEKLPENIKPRIEDILTNILPVDPFIGKSLKADYEGLYSYRVGDYRIIYEIIKHQLVIHIIKVAHRRDVYR